MELSQLTKFAELELNIKEEFLWRDFPGCSVLRDPRTNKWIALLMREWDGERGEQTERCDIKCGPDMARRVRRGFIGPAFRMKGADWVGVTMGAETEPVTAFLLLREAYSRAGRDAFTVVLRPFDGGERRSARAVPLFSAETPEDSFVPKKIREMLRLYEYGGDSFRAKCENFRRQALFMRDYEDDLAYDGDVWRYFPVYHDLSVRQLRGFFTWRTRWRRGEREKTNAAFAYIYAYELLNGTEGGDPAAVIERLEAFRAEYAGRFETPGLEKNLLEWEKAVAVLDAVPGAEELFQRNETNLDRAKKTLLSPEKYGDGAVFEALCFFCRRLGKSPAAEDERGRALFAAVWRYRRAAEPFGEWVSSQWRPLANAVYIRDERPADAVFEASAIERFRCSEGRWSVETFVVSGEEILRIEALCRAADRVIRRKLRTGRYLREKPEEEPLARLAERAIAEYERPKIVIDLTGLEKIRRDASATRDSLLTEDELDLPPAEPPAEAREEAPAESVPEGLDEFEARVLRLLLRGEDAGAALRERRVSAEIFADRVNEALYGEIGDSVLTAENGKLAVIDDYTEELQRLLGGQ